ncbi:MAG: DUF5668 domain-containing protein [Acidobacteriota bacterium]|nr:DUF5668 domain-containing protein [Acidobacteriota bacterium]
MTDKIIIQNRPPKSSAVAGILSGFLPGAGQLYNGEAPKALLFFLIFAGCISMMPHGPGPFIPLVFVGFWFYQLFDAVQTAKAINLKALNAAAGEAGAAAAGAPGFAAAAPAAGTLSSDKPAPQGSVFWGLLLMGLGFVFLLSNFEILNLERVIDFWPVAIVLIGLKIIFDSIRKHD